MTIAVIGKYLSQSLLEIFVIVIVHRTTHSNNSASDVKIDCVLGDLEEVDKGRRKEEEEEEEDDLFNLWVGFIVSSLILLWLE